MSINENVRLKGNKPRLQNAWPLGQIPRKVIINLGKQLVHRMAVGNSDITGDDFGTIFAEAIEGSHFSSPLGVADVILDDYAWGVTFVETDQWHETFIHYQYALAMAVCEGRLSKAAQIRGVRKMREFIRRQKIFEKHREWLRVKANE